MNSQETAGVNGQKGDGGQKESSRVRRRRVRLAGGACIAAAATAATVIGVAAPASASMPNGNTSNDWGNNDVVGCGNDTTGGYVAAVQDYFWGAGFPITAVDDQYGTNTLNAIKFFQSSVGLSADGCAGVNTWRKMQSFLTSSGGGTFLIFSGSRTASFLSPAFSGCNGIWTTQLNISQSAPTASPVTAGKDYKFSHTLTTAAC